MNRLSDEALLDLHDTLRATNIREPLAEAMYLLTGELLADRVVFQTFELLTTYCLERDLILRCDFGRRSTIKLAKAWTLCVGQSICGSEDGADQLTEVASVTAPALLDGLHRLAVELRLVPSPQAAV